MWKFGGKILSGKNWSTNRKTCLIASLSTTDLKWTCHGRNPCCPNGCLASWTMVNFCLNCEPTCFRLAQGLLRLLQCGQTPFSSFLIWLSAGHWLLPGWITGGKSYPSFCCKFGGHSLLLCFGVSLREAVFKLVGRPVGKTAASILRGATPSPLYVKELKLFWCGDFKIQLGLVFWHTRSPL